MQMFSHIQGAFCLVFVFSFTSYYNSNVSPQFGMSQYTGSDVQSWPKFQSGNNFTWNHKIFTSMVVNDFQVSNVITSIPWRHSHVKVSDGSRNNYMQGSSQLSKPRYSQLTVRIYAPTNGLGGGRAGLKSAGPDWKHFGGAPLSGVCKNFWVASSYKHRNHEWCERARYEKGNANLGMSRGMPPVSPLQQRLSRSVPRTFP